MQWKCFENQLGIFLGYLNLSFQDQKKLQKNMRAIESRKMKNNFNTDIFHWNTWIGYPKMRKRNQNVVIFNDTAP